VDALFAAAAGNPFFTEELVRHLQEQGRDLADPQAPVGDWAIPEGVRQVIGKRLARLGEEANRVLAYSSVLGRDLSLPKVAALTQKDEDSALDLLEEALTAHLLREEGEGYAFAHPLIQETLYQGLSAPRRRQLHRRVAEALEALYGADLEPHQLAELAHHFLQAAPGGDVDKAIDYALRAAERALSQVAYEESARLYRMALQALDLKEKPDEALRCELLLALGEAQNKAGERDKAGEAFYQAAGIAREMGAAELLARAALGRGGRYLLGEIDLANDALLVPLIEEALNALSEQDNVLRARLLALLAALIHQDSPERGTSLSQEGVEMARRIGDSAALAHALAGRQDAVWRPDNLEDRLAIATEIVRLAEEVGDKEFALVAHCQRHTCLIERGDLAAAAPDFEAHSRLAEELQQHGQRTHTVQLRAMRALLAGRLEEAERLAQQGLAIGQRTDPQLAMATFGLQMTALRKEQGRLGEMEATQKAFAQQYPLAGTGLALTYAQLGREAEARDAFERLAANGFADLPRDFAWMACVTNLAETCAFLHDAQRAATLYELLLPYAERTVVVGYAHTCFGSVSLHLGLLAATMSRWDEAVQHFEYALEMNTRLGARPYLAHTQHGYARMLIDRDASGDRDKAFRLLTEAVAMYGEIGMPKHVEMAERMLGEV
jgi:tetratricopeptide (TPR) repeat protein